MNAISGRVVSTPSKPKSASQLGDEVIGEELDCERRPSASGALAQRRLKDARADRFGRV
jgi:hypothetical protein